MLGLTKYFNAQHVVGEVLDLLPRVLMLAAVLLGLVLRVGLGRTSDPLLGAGDEDTDVDYAVTALTGCNDGSVEAVFADSGMVVGCDHAWDDPSGMAGATGALCDA